MPTPAVQVAPAVRRGERSARDVVAGALVIAAAQQERLNVNVLIDEERALARAEQIDTQVAAGGDPGPLAGVPVALKDIVDHAGRTTTCGSSFYRSEPSRSATVVERLEAAGAVIITRTGLHEWAYGFSSENPWFGPVRNPLDPTLSPGGSSGGSAAAVAAGQVTIAVGTDTGGSVRVPAALCGVFGLKVTHGRVPLTGVFPLAASLDTVGPIAGSVADLALAYTVMAGHDPADPWSVDRPVVRPGAPRPDLRALRVGIPVEWLDRAPVTDEVAEAFAATVARLQALGASVVEIRDEGLAPPGMIQQLAAGEAGAVHRAWWGEGKPYGPEVGGRIERAVAVTLDEYVAAQAWRAGVRQRAAAAFAGCDVIATPATGATRKPIGVDTIDTPDGTQHYRSVLSWFTGLVNSMGCPALVGPTAGSAAPPPPALQLVAPWWEEHRLLELAATLESEGVLGRPPEPDGGGTLPGATPGRT
jgi:aspartyl-tRNA(Asn)/glutamyl-tRNA(Gln) amidotransferase subunit A